jgi:hypothetical protein
VVVGEAGGSAYGVGGSSGGVVALDAAARGVPLTRLAVYEPPLIVDDARPPLPADYVEQLEARIAAGRPGDAVEYFMTAAIGMPAEMVGGMRESPMWAGMEDVAHTISYDGRFMEGLMSGEPFPRRAGPHWQRRSSSWTEGRARPGFTTACRRSPACFQTRPD